MLSVAGIELLLKSQAPVLFGLLLMQRLPGLLIERLRVHGRQPLKLCVISPGLNLPGQSRRHNQQQEITEQAVGR